MFSTSLEDLSETAAKYTRKAPEPLCNQFTERRSKEDAIKRHKERKELDVHALFPSCEYTYGIYHQHNSEYLYMYIL
jgi:hypothetical protein